MKDHKIAELVNLLTGISRCNHDKQCLRELISSAVISSGIGESTPSSEVLKTINFYKEVNTDSSAVSFMRDSIVKDLEKLIKAK